MRPPSETLMLRHELPRWQASYPRPCGIFAVDRSTYVQLSPGGPCAPGRVWPSKSSMPPLSRATSPSSSRRSSYQAVAAVKKRGARRRPGELSLAAPGLDLGGRLRVFQRQLRRRVERRDALLDIVRAISSTLEPVGDRRTARRARRGVDAGAELGRCLLGPVGAPPGAGQPRPDAGDGAGAAQRGELGDVPRRGVREREPARRCAHPQRVGGRRPGVSARLPRPPRRRADRVRPRAVLEETPAVAAPC